MKRSRNGVRNGIKIEMKKNQNYSCAHHNTSGARSVSLLFGLLEGMWRDISIRVSNWKPQKLIDIQSVLQIIIFAQFQIVWHSTATLQPHESGSAIAHINARSKSGATFNEQNEKKKKHTHTKYQFIKMANWSEFRDTWNIKKPSSKQKKNQNKNQKIAAAKLYNNDNDFVLFYQTKMIKCNIRYQLFLLELIRIKTEMKEKWIKHFSIYLLI